MEKKGRWSQIKTRLIQIAVSLALLAITPLILAPLNKDVLSKIQDSSKNLNLTNQSQNSYFRAIVSEVNKDTQKTADAAGNEIATIQETVTVVPNEGDQKDQKIQIIRQSDANTQIATQVEKGDEVVIMQIKSPTTKEYYIASKYRVGGLIWLVIAFAILVVLLTGLKGINAFIGLMFTLVIITQYLIPQILGGSNSLLITIITVALVLFISLPLSHGFNKRTMIALGSSIIAIFISFFVSQWAVDLTKLTGGASEDAFSLQFNGLINNLSLKGLLLSGVIIGVLGVIDDITTTQAVAVEQIAQADPKISEKDLFWRGMQVGHEHIISMVNTLALAYVGAALPLLLIFSINVNTPLWVTFNNELIAEEIVRTLIGSLCLLLAVPIVTYFSAKYLRTTKDQINKNDINDILQRPKNGLNIFKNKKDQIYEENILPKATPVFELETEENLEPAKEETHPPLAKTQETTKSKKTVNL
ncbi:MAG: YibE/F family protein [bacterium]